MRRTNQHYSKKPINSKELNRIWRYDFSTTPTTSVHGTEVVTKKLIFITASKTHAGGLDHYHCIKDISRRATQKRDRVSKKCLSWPGVTASEVAVKSSSWGRHLVWSRWHAGAWLDMGMDLMTPYLKRPVVCGTAPLIRCGHTTAHLPLKDFVNLPLTKLGLWAIYPIRARRTVGTVSLLKVTWDSDVEDMADSYKQLKKYSLLPCERIVQLQRTASIGQIKAEYPGKISASINRLQTHIWW